MVGTYALKPASVEKTTSKLAIPSQLRRCFRDYYSNQDHHTKITNFYDQVLNVQQRSYVALPMWEHNSAGSTLTYPQFYCHTNKHSPINNSSKHTTIPQHPPTDTQNPNFSPVVCAWFNHFLCKKYFGSR